MQLGVWVGGEQRRSRQEFPWGVAWSHSGCVEGGRCEWVQDTSEVGLTECAVAGGFCFVLFFVLIMVLFHLWQLNSCDCFSLVRLNFFSSTFVGWLCVWDWPTCILCLKSFPYWFFRSSLYLQSGIDKNCFARCFHLWSVWPSVSMVVCPMPWFILGVMFVLVLETS